MKATRRPDAAARPRSPSDRSRSASDPQQHDDAVLQAEARRVVHALRPFGILRKDALKRAACPTTWHEGGFDSALHAAIAAGKIEPLPFDFYRLSPSELDSGAGGNPGTPPR
ncbi:MAG TPA: hypothetical protein VGL51_13335 [Solirubrobacteraceae bacterium]